MLNSQPKQHRGLSIPSLPKPAFIALAVILVVILLVVISSVLSGRKAGKFQPFADVTARSQETLRVTSEAQQLQLQDSQTQVLAATVASALASDKQQIITYLEANHDKLSAKALGADNNKATDAIMQSAAQNNGLDSAYVTYVRTALSTYESDVRTAYSTAGPRGKDLLNSISVSVTTLLNSPPLKS